ncbi:MAG: T9SS type A sorting domain-containing protein [Paludibacter sp.]|nr:T9SS type A sorting domain-containing protein [Paludibacter sp.]
MIHFKIINGTVNGTPSEIVPNIPAVGLEWDLTEFVSGGVMRVKTATGFNPLEVNSKIFPVPCQNILNIQLGNVTGAMQISVVNLLGVVDISQQFENQNQIILNVEILPKGIYILQIKNNDKTVSYKFTKD